MTRTARRPPALGPRFWLLVGLWTAWLGFAYCVVPTAHANEGYTSDDTLQAIEEAAAETGVSYAWIYATVRCETGATWDPYAVGRRGELGAAQLAPWGELRRFYSQGFSDPFNPHEAVLFLAQRFAAGGAGAWSCS